VIILRVRNEPLVASADEKRFFRIVKAGFSARRKKLRSSLSGGLGIDKDTAGRLCEAAAINSDLRAQDLSVDDWKRLMGVAQ
jgi:16S rRNA (adenine1518-N6/adenine1519-N6)-dimethyltransferase